MKTEKINLTKLFKIGILFFGISLLLWNCEKEEIISNPSHSNLLSKLQSEFNAESFKKAIPYEFEVIWNNENKKYHKELEKYYYEFHINFTNSFNPNNFKTKNVSKYSTIYKVFVVENENQEHSFYIYKSYIENINKKKLKEKNILLEEEISNGFNHILDNEGEIVYAEKIENGKKNENILFNKEFKKKKTKDNYQSRMMQDCYTVTTYHYTDNYIKWGDGPFTYVSTRFNGTSTETICDSYWLPDLNIGGGGNSGGYYTNPGNSPAYEDCQSNSNKNYQGRYVKEGNPCKYVISVNPIECGEGYEYDDKVGECVLVEDQIFNELTGKEKCAFEKLKQLELFKTTIEKFGNGSSYNLTLKSWTNGACNSSTDDGCTDASDLANGNITIYIQNSGRGTLDAAAIILHEGIHAEIYKYVDEYNSGVDPNNRANLLNYYFQYKAQNDNTLLTSNAQHQHMADKYVKPIAQALRQLDNNQYSLNDYMGLAWDGLRRYGWDGYYDNGNWVTLERNAYIGNINKILDNTNFNNNCN